MTHNTREEWETVTWNVLSKVQTGRMSLADAQDKLDAVLHQQLQKARKEERGRIEQAHMAGYHSCCNRDASYSEARNYFDSFNHSELDQDKV